MARKNPYKEKIYEKMRQLNAELALLSELLKEFDDAEKKKGESK